jgi:hypothetical protein
VDAYALIEAESDLADGSHPNDRGHARVAAALERRLLEILPRGALSPCRNSRACAGFSFLPQFRRW